jgi:hypothetical protein
MLSICIPDWSAWHNQGVLARRRQRNMKKINRGYSSEDWRGKRYRSCLGCFSNLSDISTIATIMKPLDYEFVRVACSISILCYDCLDAIWAAQHDYGTYYVISMWWMFILSDDLWDLICYYVLDMSRCILSPRSLLLVLIQHVCESARGGWCVLNGVTR